MERGWIFKRSGIIGLIGGVSGVEEDNFIGYFFALGVLAFVPLTVYSYFFYENGGSSYQDSAYYNTYTNSASDYDDDSEDCQEPENPYGDGGGHDAGYIWAEENGGACDGNSDSFNEGCEEYYEQEEEYENCINK